MAPWERGFQGSGKRVGVSGGLFDLVDAEGAVVFQAEGVFAADDQGGLLPGGQGPFARLSGVEVEARAFPVVEAPFAAQDRSEAARWQCGERV